MWRERGLGVLAAREFRLLFAAQAATSLGNGVSTIATAFAVLDDHDGATALSIVFGIGALPQLVLLILGGAIADRVSARQRVMLLSDSARAVLQVGLAMAMLAGSVPLWAFALQQLLWNTAEAFFRPALAGLVPQTVPEDRRQEANALLAATPSIGTILGAALGGLLVAAVGPAYALLIDGVTFAASALLLAQMRVRRADRGPVEEARRGLVVEVREGWEEVRKRSWLLTGAIAEGFYSLIAVPAWIVLGPLLAQNELGGAGPWGLAESCFGVGLLLGSAVSMRWRPRRLVVGAYGALVLFVPHFVSLAVPAPVWLIALLAIPGGLSAAIWTTLWQTAIQQEVPPERLSRVSSLVDLGFFAFFPIGFALMGPLANLIGVSGVFWLSAACVLGNIVAVLSLPSARAVVRRPVVSAAER